MDRQKKHNQITLAYDKDADVLYMSEGKPREAVCQVLDDGVVVRKDPRTKEIVGFTILDFISNFSKSTAHSIPIAARFSLLRSAR